MKFTDEEPLCDPEKFLKNKRRVETMAKNASADSKSGIPAVPPKAPTFCAATVLANSVLLKISQPSANPRSRPARNESPAPVVSTTGIQSRAGTLMERLKSVSRLTWWCINWMIHAIWGCTIWQLGLSPVVVRHKLNTC